MIKGVKCRQKTPRLCNFSLPREADVSKKKHGCKHMLPILNRKTLTTKSMILRPPLVPERKRRKVDPPCQGPFPCPLVLDKLISTPAIFPLCTKGSDHESICATRSWVGTSRRQHRACDHRSTRQPRQHAWSSRARGVGSDGGAASTTQRLAWFDLPQRQAGHVHCRR